MVFNSNGELVLIPDPKEPKILRLVDSTKPLLIRKSQIHLLESYFISYDGKLIPMKIILEDGIDRGLDIEYTIK